MSLKPATRQLTLGPAVRLVPKTEIEKELDIEEAVEEVEKELEKGDFEKELDQVVEEIEEGQEEQEQGESETEESFEVTELPEVTLTQISKEEAETLEAEEAENELPEVKSEEAEAEEQIEVTELPEVTLTQISEKEAEALGGTVEEGEEVEGEEVEGEEEAEIPEPVLIPVEEVEPIPVKSPTKSRENVVQPGSQLKLANVSIVPIDEEPPFVLPPASKRVPPSATSKISVVSPKLPSSKTPASKISTTVVSTSKVETTPISKVTTRPEISTSKINIAAKVPAGKTTVAVSPKVNVNVAPKTSPKVNITVKPPVAKVNVAPKTTTTVTVSPNVNVPPKTSPKVNITVKPPVAKVNVAPKTSTTVAVSPKVNITPASKTVAPKVIIPVKPTGKTIAPVSKFPKIAVPVTDVEVIEPELETPVVDLSSGTVSKIGKTPLSKLPPLGKGTMLSLAKGLSTKIVPGAVPTAKTTTVVPVSKVAISKTPATTTIAASKTPAAKTTIKVGAPKIVIKTK